MTTSATVSRAASNASVRSQLEAEGCSSEAEELRRELLDRPPNRWYQSGFLIPSETSG